MDRETEVEVRLTKLELAQYAMLRIVSAVAVTAIGAAVAHMFD